MSGQDQQPEPFRIEFLSVVEINADRQVMTHVAFDDADFLSAVEELDARYVVGEAVAHANTWSLVTGSYSALNRHELPSISPDCVNIDHRGESSFGFGDLIAHVGSGRDSLQEIKAYVEAAHRLNDLGAVITYAAEETAQGGFRAEWRGIALLTFDGDMLDRCEVFDEADLDAALARLDELSRPVLRPDNIASRAFDRVNACFAVRDWAAIAEMLSEDVIDDDRRRMANAGVRSGRDAVIQGVCTAANLGTKQISSTPIATRGDHLALCRARYSGGDRVPDAFYSEALSVIEIDADERVTYHAGFDVDDFHSAIEELDQRYLAGEAAPHAHTWSVIAAGFGAINRGELPPTTPNWANVDHRQGAAFASGEMTAYIRAAWDLEDEVKVYVEAVHRLSDVGAVLTFVTRGTSQDGFDAEWRTVELVTVEGDMSSRCELFDESDLGNAFARFDELQRPPRSPSNTVSQLAQRYLAYIADGDCEGMETILADDISTDDRRRVVGTGVRKGKPAWIADLCAVASLSTMDMTSTTIATRGDRLALLKASYQVHTTEQTYTSELLGVFEIDDDERIGAAFSFDVDDFDSAIEELDARFLNGEAAPYAHAWAVVAASYAALNKRRLPPATPDWTSVDHRRLVPLQDRELTAYLRATWEQSPSSSVHIEAVHRLADIGAVVTRVVHGTSREGFDAEWRGVDLVSVEGDLINRCELFDEIDFDCAIKRFDELRPPRLQNAASRVAQRFADSFTAHDWDAVAQVFAEDYYNDDRRRVVNAGVRPGRYAAIEDLRVSAELGLLTSVSWESVAVRGESLVLTSFLGSGGDPEEVRVDVLQVVEVANGQIVSAVVFDFDDIDAAFAELDARYLAGEAVENSATWSVVMSVYSALNRHELPATTPDWINIDHRPLVAIEDGDLGRWIRAAWDLAPEAVIRVEAVHRLSAAGAVVTHVAYATSREGLEAEWREIGVYAFDDHRISRCEVFSGADTDAAVARFDELQSQPPPLQNAATQALQCLEAHFAVRNWVALADELAEDICTDDRRRVIGAGIRHGRAAEIQGLQAAAGVGTKQVTSTFLATRGERLVLARSRLAPNDQRPTAFYAEMIGVVEVNADNLVTGVVSFDVEDIDAAFAELDARYMAGEAAPYAHTWSVISRECAAFNRHELPATEFVTVDHRRLLKMATGNLIGDIEVTWDLMPDVSIRIESVHRLTHLGAVASYVAQGTSPEGFDAEWRITYLVTVGGDHISRCEIFDEADLDAALTRFDELTVQGKDSAPGTE